MNNELAAIMAAILAEEEDELIRRQVPRQNIIQQQEEPSPEPGALPNVESATLLLDLQADEFALSDNDPVATWADQSGNGRDFTQADATAKPTYKAAVEGYPAVFFNQVIEPDFFPQWLQGPKFANNLSSFAIFIVSKYDLEQSYNDNIIAKQFDDLSTGWRFAQNSFSDPVLTDLLGAICIDNENDLEIAIDKETGDAFSLGTIEFLARDTTNVYINGDNTGQFDAVRLGTVGDISNDEFVYLGGTTRNIFDNWFCFSGWIRAVVMYEITDLVNWPTDRAAIDAWLAARYGITL